MQNEDRLPHLWGDYVFPKDTHLTVRTKLLTHATERKTSHQERKAHLLLEEPLHKGLSPYSIY